MAALPQRPRRSMLVLFVAAEEQGLLGSQYYSLHPTFAPGTIAANINYDGGNFRGRTQDLTAIGYGKSSLDAVARAIARQAGPQARSRTSSRIAASTTAPTSSPSPRSACRRCTSTAARTSSASRRAGASSRRKSGKSTTYHQPSDEIDDTLGVRRHDRRRAARLLRGPGSSRRRTRCRPGSRATSSKRRARRRSRSSHSTRGRRCMGESTTTHDGSCLCGTVRYRGRRVRSTP